MISHLQNLKRRLLWSALAVPSSCGPVENSGVDLDQTSFALRRGATVTTVAVMPKAKNDGLSIGRQGRLFVSNAGAFGDQGLQGAEVYATRVGRAPSALGGFNGPLGSASDARGNLYVSNFNDGTIRKRDRRGRLSTFATLSGSGGGLAFDSRGRLYATSYTGNSISRMGRRGKAMLFSSDPLLAGPVGIAFDKENRMYVGNYNDGKVLEIHADGTASVIADIGPITGNNIGYLTTSRGCIYATSLNANQVFAVSPSGAFATLAGSGRSGSVDGSLEEAEFDRPNGIIANRRGSRLFVSEYGSANIRAIRLTGLACPAG